MELKQSKNLVLGADNIAAIATPSGYGGIGVIRVSGFGLCEMAKALIGHQIYPRNATFATFRSSDGTPLDQGIAIYFQAPHSYTGEEVLELQGHGGPAVMHLLLQRCLQLGARIAHPGEFTQRAFLNNKIDLIQAESVADLIEANTEQAARSAMRSLQGEFSLAINSLLSRLIELRILVEAEIDFPEEEIESYKNQYFAEKLQLLLDEVERIEKIAKQGVILREGADVVLVGAPNAGKSSLLNRLTGEDLAIVSEIPGTTRDSIRQEYQIKGIPLHLIDTAGLRDTTDAIEIIGIERTKRALTRADFVLVLLDDSQPLTEHESKKIIDQLPANVPRIYLHNKIDLSDNLPKIEYRDNKLHIYISAKTGAGLDFLQDKILEVLGWNQEVSVFTARERHLLSLSKVKNHLFYAKKQLNSQELFAEELRSSQNHLNVITGEFSSEDLLGEIFSSFCIGK